MGQQEGPADQVAADVKSGSYTILQVVEALGSSLENPEPRTRARGVQLLSQVLLQCHSLLLEKEVVHLILFYENRLKDHHLVIPSVLQGLRALSLCVALPSGLAVSVLKAIFQEVHVQSLPQVDRHTVYSIITNFMRTREEELKGLGADFTFGFIQVMDGEKDPRNLLVAFRIVHDLISRDYSLGPFVEELFEVTSCYFPIDFTPPPNDPYGIQREDLILSLRAVLASTPRFAEFLLPLLIEKVDSELLSAKLDSLQTLNACCAVYGQKELKDFLPSLWASIRREVFQTASERVEAEGLAALNSLTACLSRSVLRADAEDLLDSFLSNILQDCRHHLCEPDMKLVWPSAKLLQAAAGASARACDHITSNVLPLLLEQFHKHSQHAHVSMAEVIGLLGGRYSEVDRIVEVCAAEPCNSLSTGLQCEMDPVSQTQASETLAVRGYSVIGWYHSHPAFDPNPSLRDIDTQAKYQSYFSRGGAKFIGMIVSPYNRNNPLPYSQITCLVISDEVSADGSYRLPYKFEVQQMLEEPRWGLVFEKTRWIIEKYRLSRSSVPMDKIFRRDSDLTCLQKLLECLRKTLSKVTNCFIAEEFLTQIENLFLSNYKSKPENGMAEENTTVGPKELLM